MRGNPHVRCGKGPSEKDPNHGHLAGGLLHASGSYFAAGEGGGDPEGAREGARESWACPPSPTGSRRRSRPWSWSGGSSRSSIRTPTAIGRAARRWTRSAACRGRCWEYDWVVEFDIRRFFDSVPRDLIVKAVAGAHRPAVGGAVCQAVACRPAGAARRHAARTGSRDPAGFCDFARARESVPALRVRRLAGPGVPGRRVRALCRRRGDALPSLAQAQAGAGGAHGADGARSGWNCTRTRPGSCTARTASGADPMSTPRSRSWGSPSGRAGCGEQTGGCSWASTRRSARTP